MSDTSVGMSPNPGAVYSIQSRCICVKCGCEPRIKNPEKISGSGPYAITAVCHGEEETKYVERAHFAFTQRFFEEATA